LYAARKYDIEPQSYPYPTPATASITLYYLQSEFNNYNLKATDSGHKNLPTGSADATGISNLVLRQFHGTGTNPSNYTGPSQDFTTATSGFTVIWNSTRNWWEVTVPVTGFSGFYITSALTNVLPITLEYFNGTQNDNKHLLSWKVNSTSDKNIFEVQRGADGIHFLTLTTVNATQAQCYQPFSIIDDKPLDGINYYRLKISSTDDKTSFSNIVQLTLKTKNFQIISISPNPAKEENVTLKINTGEKSQVNINIADFTGRVLSKQTVQLTPGINKVILNSKTLTAGAYLVTVYSFNQTAKTVRLIKQ
jgi:Secretion system C-terminal sorting domain